VDAGDVEGGVAVELAAFWGTVFVLVVLWAVLREWRDVRNARKWLYFYKIGLRKIYE
jgi:hypothetical protein